MASLHTHRQSNAFSLWAEKFFQLLRRVSWSTLRRLALPACSTFKAGILVVDQERCLSMGSGVFQVLPAALALAKSPLLQGSALDALQAFLSALPACKPAGVSSDSLLASLLKAGQAKV